MNFVYVNRLSAWEGVLDIMTEMPMRHSLEKPEPEIKGHRMHNLPQGS